MALNFRFPVVSERVVFGSGNIFSPEAQARAFAALASKDIKRIDDANAVIVGRPLARKLFVDDKPTTDLYIAKSTSVIIARWSIGVEAVRYIWNLLHGAGPFKSGAYRASARMYADGVQIDNPDDAVGAREVLFVPLVPYARKIERGLAGYAPGKVYEAVAAQAKSKFSRAARIKFTYAEPEGSAPSFDPRRGGRRSAAAQNRRQPAILVFLG